MIADARDLLLGPTLDLAAQMIRGDLLLRERAIQHLGRGSSAQSTLYAARNLRAHIDLRIEVSQTVGFIFRWGRRKGQEWTTAAAEVDLTLSPSYEQPDDQSVELSIVAPSILIDPGAESVEIRLPSGSTVKAVRLACPPWWLWLVITATPDAKSDTRWSTGCAWTSPHPAAAPTKFTGIEKATGAQWHALLTAIGAWSMAPSDTAAFPLKTVAVEDAEPPSKYHSADHVIRTLESGHSQLIQTIRAPFHTSDDAPPGGMQDAPAANDDLARRHRRLVAIHPDLSRYYSLEDLSGRIDLWFNTEGTLAATEEEAAKGGHKLSFDLQQISRPGRDQLRLDPYPADVLSEGAVHRELTAYIQDHPLIADTVIDANIFPGRNPEVRVFFGEGRFSVPPLYIRFLRVSDTEDRNLAVLRGQVVPGRNAWFVFSITVQRSQAQVDDGSLKISHASLRAAYDGAEKTYAAEDLIPDKAQIYIKTLLRGLWVWHQSFAGASSVN